MKSCPPPNHGCIAPINCDASAPKFIALPQTQMQHSKHTVLTFHRAKCTFMQLVLREITNIIAPIDSDALKNCHVLQKDDSPANNHQLHQYQLQCISPQNPLHCQKVNEANAKFPNIVLAFLNCNSSATIDHSIPKIAFQTCRNLCLNSKPIAFETCPNSCYSNQNCIPNVSQFMSKHISRIEIYNI